MGDPVYGESQFKNVFNAINPVKVRADADKTKPCGERLTGHVVRPDGYHKSGHPMYLVRPIHECLRSFSGEAQAEKWGADGELKSDLRLNKYRAGCLLKSDIADHQPWPPEVSRARHVRAGSPNQQPSPPKHMSPGNEAENDEWSAARKLEVGIHELVWCVEQCNAAHETDENPEQNPKYCDDGFHWCALFCYGARIKSCDVDHANRAFGDNGCMKSTLR